MCLLVSSYTIVAMQSQAIQMNIHVLETMRYVATFLIWTVFISLTCDHDQLL